MSYIKMLCKYFAFLKLLFSNIYVEAFSQSAE